MDWERIEGNWHHFKGNARRHWVKLSDQELEAVAGNRDQLAGKIQEVYGVSKEIAPWFEARDVSEGVELVGEGASGYAGTVAPTARERRGSPRSASRGSRAASRSPTRRDALSADRG